MMRRQDGFSLIELAVVIAIIGLIVGGIIGGQTLIRNAQVSAVLANANHYADAMQQFKQQYSYLPGDFPTAVQVWGKADGNTNLATDCSPLGIDSPDGKTTCNGNGNGIMDGASTSNTAVERFENFRAWQQMAAAGYIDGKFTGASTAGTSTGSVAGTNVPGGKLTNSQYFIYSWGTVTDDGTFYAGNYDNAFVYGGASTAWPNNGIITANEAQSMDKKVDDGYPGRGNFRMLFSARTACTNSTSSSSATYVIANTTDGCMPVFMKGYRSQSTL